MNQVMNQAMTSERDAVRIVRGVAAKEIAVGHNK